MPEQQIPPEKLQEFRKNDFKKWFVFCQQVVENLQTPRPDHPEDERMAQQAQIGDIFLAHTASGENLRIVSLVVPRGVTDSTLTQHTQMYFFAFNAQGKIVGYRWTDIDAQEPVLHRAVGAIATLRSGVSRAIEAAHIHILQRWANANTCDVVYSLDNTNRENYDEARETRQQNPKKPYSKIELTVREEQLPKWENLYGPYQSLGVNEDGKLSFHPEVQVDEDRQQLGSLPNIFLPRPKAYEITIVPVGEHERQVHVVENPQVWQEFEQDGLTKKQIIFDKVLSFS